MPVLNEIDFLERAFRSLSSGDYPTEKLEFILVDGGSTDGTLELISRLALEGINIRVIHNRMRTTPYALNLGIEAAAHDIILRADAHAHYEENYISKSVALLESGVGDNIGGVIVSVRNTTKFSELLAYVLNSRLGNGGAGYRRSAKGRFVDTVWCGCWYKSTLEKVGMFDVDWINNQDAELNARLIAQGFRVFSDPDIRAYLVVRPTLTSFMKQYFRYGRGRLRTLYRHPHILRYRQIIPIIAVIILLISCWIAPLLTIGLFLAVSLFVSLAFRFVKKGFSNLPMILQIGPFPLIVIMNLCWAAGMVSQLSSQMLGSKQSS